MAGPRNLRDYALIGDGERGALIDSTGAISWMCFPSWSDQAIFAGMLGSGGRFQVLLDEPAVSASYYERDSLIWHGRWITRHGTLESRDALLYPAEQGRAVLLRRFLATTEAMKVRIVIEPALEYGKAPVAPWKRVGSSFVTSNSSVTMRLTGASDAKIRSGLGRATLLLLDLELQPGRQRDLVLEICRGDHLPREAPDVDQCWKRTEVSWHDAIPDCTNVVASQDVSRSIAILRAMTNDAGATVAAATTSLPEHDGADRNYDYRYCWIRDICYIGQAGASMTGADALFDGALGFVTARLNEHGDHTSPAYLPDGRRVPAEVELDLPGYPGGHNVVGNRVRDQFQLDIFGEALLLLANGAAKDRLQGEHRKAIEICIAAIEKHAGRNEAGIWETKPKRWTHSRLIAVAGLRAIATLEPAKTIVQRALPLADHLLSTMSTTCLHESGRWMRAPDDERIDASLLLAQIRGACDADDPRSRATLDAVQRELVDDDYVYRYRRPGHHLGEDEGAFLICNFWMSLACLGAGRIAQGTRYFERARSACGSPGLFSEEYDVGAHQLRGNLPQAFVHALLIETAAAQAGLETNAP